MLLNKEYYQNLLVQYENIETVSCELNDRISLLSLQMIIERCRKRMDIHIHIQNNEKFLFSLGRILFTQLANEIFCNAADFPELKVGDKVKSKKVMHVGKPKPLYLDFSIRGIRNNKYELWNEKHSVTMQKSFSEIVGNYIPVSQNAQNDTLAKFILFFDKLNGKSIHDFNPTYFERKSVFIANKNYYDSLHIKNKIPITYFPNSRDDANLKPVKSIPALPDSMMYVVPKYKICYDELLQKGKRIDTIVVFDTEIREVERIINDKIKYQFNLVVLTSEAEAKKFSGVPRWDWYKEELEIINSI